MTEVPDQETGEIKKLFTFTLVTRSADGSFKMQNIHNDGDNRNRMPLMLPFDLSKKWVETGEFTEEEYNSILEFQMGDENIEAVPVYTIRSAKERPDGKLKKEYFEWDKLPPLGLANPDWKNTFGTTSKKKFWWSKEVLLAIENASKVILRKTFKSNPQAEHK